nr:cytidine deaminase [uncultured Prevotella sp.]
MKNLTLSIPYQSAQLSELSAEDQHLIHSAIEATANSYAHYSHFHVGAAVRIDNGREIIGANQENAAFPSGLCGERTAIFAAQAQFPEHRIVALAVAAKNTEGLLKSPVTPCGQCRQVILEIEDRYKKPVRILLYGTDRILVFNTVRDILPFSFVEADMNGKKDDPEPTMYF